MIRYCVFLMYSNKTEDSQLCSVIVAEGGVGGGFNPQLFGRHTSYYTEIYPGVSANLPTSSPVRQ